MLGTNGIMQTCLRASIKQDGKDSKVSGFVVETLLPDSSNRA